MEDKKELCKTSERLKGLGRTQQQQADHINDPDKEAWKLILYGKKLHYKGEEL